MTVCALASLAGADEPWMFPLKIKTPTTQDELDSMMIIEMYGELRGNRYAENTSRVVHTSIASFEDIVKMVFRTTRWFPTYRPNLLLSRNELSLNQTFVLNTFLIQRSIPTKARALVTSWFTPVQKQVTTLFPDKDGSIIAISLLGMEKKTRITVMRRRSAEAGR